ncbi:MAG: aminopeptidase P family protein [Clostridia bacterium]|nr:aminopeptidase P family protein [Clostridia bacterium]
MAGFQPVKEEALTHLQRFQKRLDGGCAALISSAQNRFYLSGFHFDDGYLLVLPDAAFLLTDFRYEEAAEKTADPAFTVLSPKGAMLGAVAEILAERGAKSLLFEENDVTFALYRRLQEKLTAVSVTGGAAAILSELRVLKDAGELAAIRRAQEITDAAFSHILGVIRPGVRELDVALELEFFMRRMGAEGAAFDTIAVSGTASALPHGVPRDRVLEKGFFTMDFGARFGGYCADMTRTVVIGRADEEMKRLYHTVLAAQETALSRAAAGVSCRALDLAARELIDGAGYEGCFGHSLGHGVGIDIHEAPRLSRTAPEDAVLTPGHVVTVEPGIYLKGKYGCRIEDLIAITPDGRVENLTKSTKELIEL